MMKPSISVSVIIPCYNAATYVAEAVASVFAQTRSDFEVIVVNDGSPDAEELEAALAVYRDRIVYISQENRGVSSARNTGIRAARGEFVALLDSDDAWEPDYLAVQLAILARNPDVDIVYPNVLICGNTLEKGWPSMDHNPSHGAVTFKSIVTQQCNVHSCVTARREVILRAGLFDESLRSSEDFDLWLRVVKLGGRIDYHRKVLVRYRRRGGSLSSDPIWMCQHVVRVLDKADRTLSLTVDERSAVVRERGRWYAAARVHEGKQRMAAGDYGGAISQFMEANAILGQRKLAIVIRVLRLAPGLLARLYVARDSILQRVSSRDRSSTSELNR